MIPAFFYIFVLIVIKNITFVYDQLQQIVSKFLDKIARQVILEKICHLQKSTYETEAIFARMANMLIKIKS